jgi:hypothetical protein
MVDACPLQFRVTDPWYLGSAGWLGQLRGDTGTTGFEGVQSHGERQP